MESGPRTYHQRVAHEKRALIVRAATALFLELGYDRSSLARIAEVAGVSKATLFKQFPTKAALFDAIVTESWAGADDVVAPPVGDLTAGLTAIGQRYAALLTRPEMADLFRIVIAELPRFPELAQAQFSQGKMPYFDSVRRYLEAETEAGTAAVPDTELATTQFLGMISNHLFWPRLLVPGWSVDPDRAATVVDEAVATMVARYAAAAPGAADGRRNSPRSRK